MSDAREIRIGLVSGVEFTFNVDEFDFSADDENNLVYVTSVEGTAEFSHYVFSGSNITYVHYNFE